MWQVAAEVQPDKMESDMGACMEQKCRIEFLHTEKKLLPLTFIDTCQTFMGTK